MSLWRNRGRGGKPAGAARRVEDGRLVRRMLAGDSRAFDEFFSDFFPRLYQFALVRLDGDPDRAEEIVQATLCRAIFRLRTFRGEAPLFSWLCTFCRHEIFSSHRESERAAGSIPRSGGRRPGPETLPPAAGNGRGDPDPEEAILRGERAGRVRATLARIPSPYGHVLRWKYLEGFSVRKISVLLESSPKATESLLTRARRAFRLAFSRDEGTPTSQR